MPRVRRFTKEEAYFIILKKMFLDGRLSKGDFEPTSRNTQRIPGDFVFQESRNSEINENSGFSRSSNKKWFDELEEKQSIEKTRIAKPRQGISALYDITFLGLIELLGLSYERGFDSDIWAKFYYHLPHYLHPIFEKLRDLYSNECLFLTFAKICKNTKLWISTEPRNESRFPVVLKASFHSSEYKWVHYYQLETYVSHADSVHHLIGNIAIGGRSKLKKEMWKKHHYVIKNIRSSIFAAFLHELINGKWADDLGDSLGYIDRNNIVLDIIKNNHMTKKDYLQFLQNIETIEKTQMDFTRQIKRKILN